MEKSPNPLSAPQMPPFSEKLVTIPIRSDTVRFGTAPRTIRSDIEFYNIVPCVFDAVQHGTSSNLDFVPITVPFSFVEGLETSKRNNTHFKNKYKKKFSRTPSIVPRIIELSKDADPHLDQGLILNPLTVVTMDPVVHEPKALGGPTGT
jgi:hypothetical protein